MRGKKQTKQPKRPPAQARYRKKNTPLPRASSGNPLRKARNTEDKHYLIKKNNRNGNLEAKRQQKDHYTNKKNQENNYNRFNDRQKEQNSRNASTHKAGMGDPFKNSGPAADSFRKKDIKDSTFIHGKNRRAGNHYLQQSSASRNKSFPSGRPNRQNKRKTLQSHDPENADELIRLNRYIANSGVCSRREADTLIQAGLITVNGQIITAVGTKVKPNDDVRYNGQRLHPERKVYILLNKPKDCVTTTDDPHAKHTVMDLIRNACKERVYPVGRLDRNTTGVLLLTNDGELAKKLTHPSHQIKKIYHVVLDRNVRHEDMQALLDGVKLDDDTVARADEVSYVNEKKSEVGLEIHSGINRVVRRMFEQLGYKVIKLDRVYFAGLTKKNVERGKWRMLTPDEVNHLKMMAG